MRKDTAITEMGGSVPAAAKALDVSPQAIRKWPDDLPDRIADRVLAAIARRELPAERLKQLGIDVRARAAEEQAEASHG